MKYFYLCLLIFVFWIGRNSVNSSVVSLQKDLFQKNTQYDRLRSDYENLEKEIEQIRQPNQVAPERRPATVSDIEVKNTDEVFIPQKVAEPENHKVDNQEVENNIRLEKVMSIHLDKVMKYVSYLNESDSGAIIAFLKQQKAPNKQWFKHYNDEIDSTISKIPVRCETYMADCFENSQGEDEKNEVVFCATQSSRCLSEQYQEIKPSEINNLE